MFGVQLKNTKDFYWTAHIKRKMRYYRLSQSRLRRILNNPQRKEAGIAENTIALMQKAETKKPSEIWLMYQLAGKTKKMISAWRYPGVSPKGKPISIPDDVIADLQKEGVIFDKIN